jgi:RNA polymerase sigma factor (sigma-70 family)
MDGESSVALLLRARAGDATALNDLLQRYLPALRRFARGRLPAALRDLADTDDLVQDSLIQTVRRLDEFEPRHRGALHAYLRVAVLNRIRDECRRAARRPATASLDGAVAGDPSPLDIAIGHEAMERYEAALERLSESDREALIARVEFGFSYADVATYLSKPSPYAARVAVNRALVRLAALMT